MAAPSQGLTWSSLCLGFPPLLGSFPSTCLATVLLSDSILSALFPFLSDFIVLSVGLENTIMLPKSTVKKSANDEEVRGRVTILLSRS